MCICAKAQLCRGIVMQLGLFSQQMAPPTMRIRCRCGYSEDWTLERLSLATTVPTGAVSIWADCCPRCDPRIGFAPWGWVMADGKRVGGT